MAVDQGQDSEMCRYGYKTYKSHFACFSCRKAFKKTALEDYVKHQGLDQAYTKLVRAPSPRKRKQLEAELAITYAEIRDAHLHDVSTCPECGEPMAAMGLDFRAPKRQDKEAWQIVELLYQHGFRFAGCGCFVGYAPPSKLRDVPGWLEQHTRQSDGKKLLEKIRAKSAHGSRKV